MAATKKYLPLQHVKRGKAGYKGKDIVVMDGKGKSVPEAIKVSRKK